MKVSIILVHYSNLDNTSQCISSLMQQRSSVDYEINIIINNHKKIDYDKLRNKYNKEKHINVYMNASESTGFSSGIACGLAYSANELLVVLDNDATVEKNWLDELVKPMTNDKKIGITTSKIIDPDHANTAIIGGKVNLLGFSFPNRIYDNSDHEKGILFYGITAWCIRKEILEKIKIDEKFLFFSDDADIGFKVKSLGYKIMAVPSSIAYHYKTDKDNKMDPEIVKYKMRICNRDYLIFSYKNLLLIHFIIFFLIFLLIKLLFLPKRILIQKDTFILQDFLGILSFFGKDNNLNSRRKSNQDLRKVSYFSLLKQFSKKLYVGTVIFK